MTELVIFTGVMIAIIGLAWNEKWYTKLGRVVVGLLFAALPFIFYLLAPLLRQGP